MLLSICSVASNKIYILDPPGGCTSGFTAPQGVTSTSYYGVGTTQAGNAWVSNAGKYYKNATGHTETSGATAPTCSSGTCSDGGVTWRFEANNQQQCVDDIAHYVYPVVDGVSLVIPWSSDEGGVGIETSNSTNTAHQAYSYTAFDATVTNGTTGYLDNPNWPAGGKIIMVVKAMRSGGNNVYIPNYVVSTVYAASLLSSAQNVGFCSSGLSYAGQNNGGTLPVNTIANINTSGVQLATLVSGWLEMIDTPASTAYQALATNIISHYNSVSWNSSIAYMRFGVGTGGESLWACNIQAASFYSLSNSQMLTTWLTWTQSLFNTIAAASPNFTIDEAQDCAGGCKTGTTGIITNVWADDNAAKAVAAGFGVGGNGETESDITFFSSGGVSAGSGISNDFAYIWNTYPSAALHEFQQVSFTDPTGVNAPGSLVDLLPFAQARGGDHWEAFYQDLCVALCPNYYQYATYHTAYQTVITTFHNGGTTINPPHLTLL